jgi:hypothetical protein
MDRRGFLLTLASALAAPLVVEAQQAASVPHSRDDRRARLSRGTMVENRIP